MSKKFRPVKWLKQIVGVNKKVPAYPPDFDSFHIDIIEQVRPFTMTSPERLYGLIEAVRYLESNEVVGNFVECGVWKGGSMMAVALTLQKLGKTNRHLYLYDTYEGMTAPTAADLSYQGEGAAELLQKESGQKEDSVIWAYSSLEQVKKNVLSTGYPESQIHFIQGDVLKTIPDNVPDSIALLRLDTDWYESTRHEMIHLYPLLVSRGVLIIDDYGFWRGSRQAVDEYIAEHHPCLLLNRMDDTGRIAIKL
ncbi:MAG: TylF/MycF/NovP-related O-methyltransferase [Sediminibacterium sp.]